MMQRTEVECAFPTPCRLSFASRSLSSGAFSFSDAKGTEEKGVISVNTRYTAGATRDECLSSSLCLEPSYK
jgi:hypothetical protein